VIRILGDPDLLFAFFMILTGNRVHASPPAPGPQIFRFLFFSQKWIFLFQNLKVCSLMLSARFPHYLGSGPEFLYDLGWNYYRSSKRYPFFSLRFGIPFLPRPLSG